MTQVLVAIDDHHFGTLLQANIIKKYNQDVLVLNSLDKTLSMIGLLSVLTLVICPKKFAQKIGEFIIKNHDLFSSNISIIIIGKVDIIYPDVFFVPEETPLLKLLHQVGFVLGKETEAPSFSPEIPVKMEETEKTTVFRMPIEEVEVRKEEAMEFISFSMKYFQNLPEVEISFNLYSRIKKHDGFDYNLKIATHTKIKRADIERLIVRGGRELYVKITESDEAKKFLTGNFLARFQITNLDVIDRLQLNSDSFDILLDVFKNSSMDKYSVEIIKELIKSFDFFMKLPNGYDVFHLGLKSKNLSYGYKHAHFTSLLLYQIADKFPWSKEHSKNKIIYLSIFHDLALWNERIIKLHHNFFHEQDKFSEDELEVVINHADSAATILETIVKAPKELTSIIREHHGMRSGKGLPEVLSLGITALSMTFIVTEDFVTRYLSTWEKRNKGELDTLPQDQLQIIFAELDLKYDKLTYLDAVQGLKLFFKDT